MTVRINALSVDDEKSNLLLVEAMAGEIGITVNSFLSPIAALDFPGLSEIDLVFTDYMMPGMNGIEFIEEIRRQLPHIHIIMITSVQDDDSLKLRALQAGATEFLNKPLNIAEFKARVSNIIELHSSRLLLRDRALLLESEVREATVEIVEREHETLAVLARAAEYRDHDTGAHVSRVAHYSRLISESIGESQKNQDLIFGAAPLHDVGKIGIPDSILMKKGGLTAEESAIMRTHPLIGFEILKNSQSAFLQAGAIVCLSHHEKFDGSGYPNGLKGDDIPLIGRIVAVADVFDALSNERPYKKPWVHTAVVDYLMSSGGTHFDPVLVEHLFKNMDKALEIMESLKD